MGMAIWNVLALVGCAPEPAAPPAEEAPKEECTLSFDTLAGKTFVRRDPPSGDTFELDLYARARFSKEGDAVKMRYTTRDLVKLFDYTCAKAKGEILCLQDKPDLTQWCQTLIANKGSCSAAELADLTGAKVPDAMKAHDELMAKVSKLSPEELEKMNRAFSQPNNQLRGLMHVKINKETCQLTVRDTYQTMTNGQLNEVETFVGNSVFTSTDKELMFDDCGDQASLVALTAPDAKGKVGETKIPWNVGETVPFRNVGDKGMKPEAGCAYTMDQWVMYEPVQKGASVAPGADGTLAWAFTQSFDKPGTKIAHMVRSKTCNGGAPERIDVSCVMVKVAGQ
jgi:hypothetical protein